MKKIKEGVEIQKKIKGITLIALVITIIVLLILAGVTIATLTGENGILTQAEKAKDETEIGKEKEITNLAILATKGKDIYGKLDKEELQKQLDALAGKGKTEVSDSGERMEVYFKESKRYYEVDKDGNIGDYQIAVEINNAGDITKGGILDGSEEKPYEINCIEDLVAFSNMVNGTGIKLENGIVKQVTTDDSNKLNGKKVILKRTLNFKSKYSYENSERTDFGDINGNDTDGNKIITEMTTGMGFKPIGFDGRTFTGTFDGKEESLQNLFIDYRDKTSYNVGLFGEISSTTGIVKNLTVTGEIKSNCYSTGGIVGLGGYTIENCTNKANVEGKNYVGGINGKAAIKIINCKNSGNILINQISIADGGAGGIIGSNGSEIVNCKNYGTVDGVSVIGGIIGCSNAKSIINDCYNKGKIGTEEYSNNSGGILGYHRGNSIKVLNCMNQGEIFGKGNKGGIVGTSTGVATTWEMEIAICNSYNIGKIESKNGTAGGIIGIQGGGYAIKYYSSIENVWNTGEVSGIYLGSIIGYTSKINNPDVAPEVKREIRNAYYTNSIAISSGTDYTGEAIQKTIAEMKTQEFVDLLNNNIEGNTEWNRWKFVENQFPEFE